MMFEVPAAKRVKRSQLFGSDDEDKDSSIPHAGDSKAKKSDDKIDEDDHNTLPDYGFEYDFISPNEKPNTNSDSKATKALAIEASKPTNNDIETYQFNLFAPSRPHPSKAITPTNPSSDPSSATTTAPITTSTSRPPSQPLQISISIRSPSPTLETSSPNAGTLIDPRPDSHYFTSALPPQKLQTLRTSYLSAAIDHLTLKKLTTLAWPGTHHPWRRIALPAHRKQVVIVRTKSAPAPVPPSSLTTGKTTATETGTNRHRARPSKKRRDLAKTRAQKRQILIDESKTKEEHEREKRNKKNRERKLKRRAKERREKEAKGGGGGEGGEVGDGNVSVSDGGSVDGSAD